jgi:diazepam-binding inhibitor (GABA receptor modulating acyl-CoA-binding protein)
MSDPASTGNAAFVTATEEVKKLAQSPSNDDLLILYGLFKQAIHGDNTTAKPGMFDLTGKAKWEAWNKLQGTSKEDAQAQYIAKVNSLKG